MIHPVALRYLPHALAALAVVGVVWWGYSTIWDRGYARCEAEHSEVLAQATAQAHQDYLDAVARGDALSARLATAQSENRRLKDELSSDIDRLRGLCPAGLRLIHDAAAAGRSLPDAARASLDSPATVDARAVAHAVADNYAACRGYIDQLNALIDWHDNPKN